MPQPRNNRFRFDWTPRRANIVRDMMRDGQQIKEIAQVLGCSVNTIQKHLDSPAPKERR